jgi:pantetheine-phosphate adenylyltransferase
MKVAFYPGSFSPWHEGHGDVLEKALKVFDKIVILQLTNTDKGEAEPLDWADVVVGYDDGKRVELVHRKDVSIIEAVGTYILGEQKVGLSLQYAIVRGLRNERDFCDEQILNYWYEDLGIKMPIVYFIADRSLVHISSSAIKAANKFTEK